MAECMKNLFSVISSEFFKPLTGKYKTQYADCLLLIFSSFKSEISYGVDKEAVIAILTDYFNTNTEDISFNDEESFENQIIKVANLIEREKSLKKDIKQNSEKLLAETKRTIENLTDNQALELLKEKWISPLISSLKELPNHIIKDLISKVSNFTISLNLSYKCL